VLANTARENDLIASLELDPRTPRSTQIAVSADGAIGEMRGMGESFGHRRAAVNEALPIQGVHEVDDQLTVSLLGSDHREDDDIPGAAPQIPGQKGPVGTGQRRDSGRLSHSEKRRQLPVRERPGR
jgi:hypothetical protein